jgi:hypothetical protein
MTLKHVLRARHGCASQTDGHNGHGRIDDLARAVDTAATQFSVTGNRLRLVSTE